MNGSHEYRRWKGVIGLALVVVIVGACATSGVQTDDATNVSVDPDGEFRDGATTQVAYTSVSNRVGFDFGTVYFAFDKATIADDARSILESAGTALGANGRSIVIEGHCDDVGSSEYNLALGERRADAVRRYLFNLGVPREQMKIVSYGESKPALRGTGEAVWRLNRRAEITSRR